MGGKGSGRKPVRKPWEQQNEEDPKRFEAFRTYRDMGPSRNLVGVSQALSKSVTLMKRWSYEDNWVRRARAWDAELDRRGREAEAKELEKMRQRHIQLAMGLQTVAAKELKKLVERAEKTGKAVTVDQLIRLVEQGVKLERLNRGEPTEHITNDVRLSWSELVKRAQEAKQMVATPTAELPAHVEDAEFVPSDEDDDAESSD